MNNDYEKLNDQLKNVKSAFKSLNLHDECLEKEYIEWKIIILTLYFI